MQQRFTRSSPIAIKRSPGYNDSSGGIETSDEEEDDDSLVDVVRDAVKLGLVSDNMNDLNMSRSLPSRLLKAPRLGSVPTNEDYISYRSIPAATLPPPMTLNDAPPLSGSVRLAPEQSTTTSATTTSYGSLRESNMQGRFFDGPSSYRDSRTGDIRRLEQRVRFSSSQQGEEESSETAQQQPESNLSIRERMKQARDKKANDAEATATNKPTSSLAAMFDGTKQNIIDTQQPSASEMAVDDFQSSTSFLDSTPFYETTSMSALPSGALSTSLTGLEMLQRGLRLATIADHDSQFSDDQLPRDANGHNALLSRSFSDPRGAGRRLAGTQQRSSPAMLAANNHQGYPPQMLHSTTANLLPPPLSLGSAPSFLPSAAAGPVLVSHLSAVVRPKGQESLGVADSRVPDADVEGAFEMDLE